MARDGRELRVERHHLELLERVCRALDQAIDAEEILRGDDSSPTAGAAPFSSCLPLALLRYGEPVEWWIIRVVLAVLFVSASTFVLMRYSVAPPRGLRGWPTPVRAAATVAAGLLLGILAPLLPATSLTVVLLIAVAMGAFVVIMIASRSSLPNNIEWLGFTVLLGGSIFVGGQLTGG